MSEESNQKTSFRTHQHRRSILFEAAYTIQKIQKLQQQEEKLRDSAFKKKLDQSNTHLFRGIRQPRFEKPNRVIESRTEYGTREDDFEWRLKCRQEQQLAKINSRIEQLKKRIMPGMEEGQILQSKLNEIIDIHHNNPKKLTKNGLHHSLHSSKTKPLLTLPQQTDFREVQSKFWNKLSQETKLQKSTVNRIRSNRMGLLMKKVGSEDELRVLQKLKPVSLSKTKISLKNSKSSTHFSNAQSRENIRNSSPCPTFVEQSKSIRASEADRSNQLAEWEMIRYLKQKQKRKKFVNSISKELIEDEKAVKIYSLVKGGYPIDKSDVEGEFISLRRFNNARGEFATLNWMYKAIQEEVTSKSMKNQQLTLQDSKNNSFKRLVQINELFDKFPPNYMQKLMKTSKIVT